MKKINLFAVAGIILAVVVAGVLVFSFAGKKSEEPTFEIFKLSTPSQVEQYAKDKGLSVYSDFDNVISVGTVTVLDHETEVVFDYYDDAVYQSYADIVLFEYEGEDIASYTFSAADKEEIEKRASKVIALLGEELGCTIEQYDVVNNMNSVDYKDETDAFFSGLITREYSIRDANGILWLFRVSAFNNYAKATLTCIADETGYDGFIPSIDLTAEE